MKKLYFKSITVVLFILIISISKTNAQQVIAAIQDPNVILIDPSNGQITDPSFIDLTPLSPGTPKAIIQVDNEIWISDQIADRIDRFDLSGQYLGAITGGLDNIKGMAVVDNNEVWVTNAGTSNGAPGDALVRIDFNGNILGNISTGTDSSFDIIDNGAGEVYISYIGTNTRIERRDYTGAVIGNIVGPGVVNFIQQIDTTSTGDLLAGVFSNNTTSGNSQGIYNFSETNGSILNYWSQSGVRGVTELDDGNILWSNSSGLSLLNIGTGTSTLISGGNAQYFGLLLFDCASNPTSAPTGDAAQILCNGDMVGDLSATGTSIQWYDAPTGGNLLSSSDLLVNGNYYASQTIAGCESTSRLEVMVSVQDPSAPTGDQTQDFCIGSTVSDLSPTGTSIQWYDAPTGGNLLSSSDLLANGTYYASQTVAGCESSSRLEVLVSVQDPSAPTGDQTQDFCIGSTVSDLSASGLSIQWYDAPTGGNLLSSSDLLASDMYYASQTVDGCEGSSRLEVTVTINNPSAPTGDQVQTFCDSATVDDLQATGSNITWYDAASGGNVLANTEDLIDGESYYASQTVTGCEGNNMLEVFVTLNSATPITGDANQLISVVNANDATLNEIIISPSNVVWYATEADALSGTNPLPGNTILTDGETYYAVNEENGCFSEPFEVTVTVEVTAGLKSYDNEKLNYYPNPTSDILSIEYSKIISELKVTSLLGKTLIINKSVNSKEVQLDLSSLPPATYFVEISVKDNTSKVIKVVKRD